MSAIDTVVSKQIHSLSIRTLLGTQPSRSGLGGGVVFTCPIVERKVINLWPARLMGPTAVLLVELVHFSATFLGVTQVYTLHLFRLDYHNAEVLSGDWMV